MSYDLMVFDAQVAPRSRKAFLKWFDEQTQWTESHGYNDPAVPSLNLRTWFREMIETFPPMNGPLASDDVDDSKVTDYSLGRAVIYAAFSWSETAAAYEAVTRLAIKHRVGFFNVSSASADIWFPTSDGRFEDVIN